MLKRTTKHQNYEVWSEDAADSVFVDHRPNKEEIDYLWETVWPKTVHRPEVFKLIPFYTTDPKQYRKQRGED